MAFLRYFRCCASFMFWECCKKMLEMPLITLYPRIFVSKEKLCPLDRQKKICVFVHFFQRSSFPRLSWGTSTPKLFCKLLVTFDLYRIPSIAMEIAWPIFSCREEPGGFTPLVLPSIFCLIL